MRRAVAAGAAISAARSGRPVLSPGPRPPKPSIRTGSLAAQRGQGNQQARVDLPRDQGGPGGRSDGDPRVAQQLDAGGPAGLDVGGERPAVGGRPVRRDDADVDPGGAGAEAGQHLGCVHAGQAAAEDVAHRGRLDHDGGAQRVARAGAEDQQVAGRDSALGQLASRSASAGSRTVHRPDHPRA
jgi:hypothetical protein